MAQETNEGIAYLMALKQTGHQQGASAPAPAQETNPDGQPSTPAAVGGPEPLYQGAEKRRSSRYKCEGSVEIREDGCDVRTWASCTDISLHGCYVEAQATYPAGATLHMKLEANGIRVETKCNVRVNYPYLGMGIAFVDMSEDSRARLKELLGTVSRPATIMGLGIASHLPSCGPLDAVPPISDPAAAIQALIAFFENRHMLTREDFLTILTKTQVTPPPR
jgi:hypothetical protein